MFLLFVSLHEPLPWGKLFPEISGEPMSLGSGSHEDFGWWHWSHWNVLCCPWGLAPAWRGVGLSDLCSSQFKVFLLLILFATRGPWGECSWVSGVGQGSLSRAHPPLRREPREKCKLWWVKEGKNNHDLSPGGVLPLSAPVRGRVGSCILRGRGSLRL